MAQKTIEMNDLRKAALYLIYNKWEPQQRNGLLDGAASLAGVTPDTISRWARGKRRNKRWDIAWKEALKEVNSMGIDAFDNLKKMTNDTGAQIYLAKIAAPDVADDQLIRQKRSHQRKLERIKYENELAIEAQKNRPPLVIKYEEVDAKEAPDAGDLAGLIEDEEEN